MFPLSWICTVHEEFKLPNVCGVRTTQARYVSALTHRSLNMTLENKHRDMTDLYHSGFVESAFSKTESASLWF